MTIFVSIPCRVQSNSPLQRLLSLEKPYSSESCLGKVTKRARAGAENEEDLEILDMPGPVKKLMREVNSSSNVELYTRKPATPGLSLQESVNNNHCLPLSVKKPNRARKSITFVGFGTVGTAIVTPCTFEQPNVTRKRMMKLDLDGEEDENGLAPFAKRQNQCPIAPSIQISGSLPSGPKRSRYRVASDEEEENVEIEEFAPSAKRQKPVADFSKPATLIRRNTSRKLIAPKSFGRCRKTIQKRHCIIDTMEFAALSNSKDKDRVVTAQTRAKTIRSEEMVTTSKPVPSRGTKAVRSFKTPISIPVVRLAAFFQSKLKLSSDSSHADLSATQRLQNPFPLHLLNQKKRPYLYKYRTVYHCIRQEPETTKSSNSKATENADKPPLPVKGSNCLPKEDKDITDLVSLAQSLTVKTLKEQVEEITSTTSVSADSGTSTSTE